MLKIIISYNHEEASLVANLQITKLMTSMGGLHLSYVFSTFQSRGNVIRRLKQRMGM